jgi:hypothetical protein
MKLRPLLRMSLAQKLAATAVAFAAVVVLGWSDRVRLVGGLVVLAIAVASIVPDLRRMRGRRGLVPIGVSLGVIGMLLVGLWTGTMWLAFVGLVTPFVVGLTAESVTHLRRRRAGHPLKLGDRVEWAGPGGRESGRYVPEPGERGWLQDDNPMDEIITWDRMGTTAGWDLTSPEIVRVGDPDDADTERRPPSDPEQSS